MQRYTVYFLKTAVHVLGGTPTHQERKNCIYSICALRS